MSEAITDNDQFWRKTFSSTKGPSPNLDRRSHKLSEESIAKIDSKAEFWQKRLFEGVPLNQSQDDKLVVFKNGRDIQEISLDRLPRETVIGRHPKADLQLESPHMAMFHLILIKKDGRLFVKVLDEDAGILLDRKKLKSKKPVPLWNGSQIDLPSTKLQKYIR
jgi:glycine betaine catabolism B